VKCESRHGLAVGGEFTEDERVCHHIVYCVAKALHECNVRQRVGYLNLLSISKIIKRALLVNDPDSGLLRPDANTFDIFARLPEVFKFIVDYVRCLDGGLSVEFCRVRYFKENVFHDVGGVWDLEFERLSLHIVRRHCQHTLKNEVP
jgi:hypothetical protein